MVKLENYLNDGACWQSQAVLAFLRTRYDSILESSWNPEWKRHDATIYCGRYENCREQGYVFSLSYKGHVRHYAVYEHRNSDEIIVLISTMSTINTPGINDMWADKGENATKYDYDKAFRYFEIVDCGNWIVEDMKKHLSEWIESEKKDS